MSLLFLVRFLRQVLEQENRLTNGIVIAAFASTLRKQKITKPPSGKCFTIPRWPLSSRACQRH